MTRSAPTRLLVALAAAVIAIAALTLGGRDHGPTRRRPARAAAGPADTAAPTPAVVGRSRAADPAVAIARAYVLAARDWSAATYRHAFRSQLALAGGRYRRRLLAASPTPGELAQLHADRASLLAAIIQARRRLSRAGRAVVTVWLDERAELAGQAFTTSARYLVSLGRLGGRWRVAGFTALPGPGGAR